MITNISTERLAVISDLHLGNPLSKCGRDVTSFVNFCAQRGYDLCINGDTIDIAQFSFRKLVRDVPPVFHAIRLARNNGCRIFYLVGNHDIMLEHFLDDWGAFETAPFLNVSSGDKRIRIEHGHLYDPFFIKFPNIYTFCTWIAGFFLKLHPKFYTLSLKFGKIVSCLYPGKDERIAGEHPNFNLAALEMFRRGFDTVVFGHTHHVGQVEIQPGKWYFNTGSWMSRQHYLFIENGLVTLKIWKN